MEDLISPVRTRLSAMTQAQRRRLGELVGVPFETIQKIATGETADPRISTWAPIASALGIACAVPREPTFCHEDE